MYAATPNDVKNWLGLSLNDSKLDEVVNDAINAAEDWVHGVCNRRFDLATSASARYYDVNPITGTVTTDDIGDPSVTVATDNTNDGTFATSWSTSDFQLLPLRGDRPYYEIRSTGAKSFPSPISSRTGLVKVTAKWGWPSVPSGIHQAVVMQAARIVNRRNSPNGVAGANDFGVVRIASVDRDIQELVADFRLVGVA